MHRRQPNGGLSHFHAWRCGPARSHQCDLKALWLPERRPRSAAAVYSATWSSMRLPTLRLFIRLLPRPADLEFLFLAPEFRRTFPLQLVPVNRERVVDGDRVIHELPHGGKR